MSSLTTSTRLPRTFSTCSLNGILFPQLITIGPYYDSLHSPFPFPILSTSPPLPLPVVHDDMPTAPVALLDHGDILDDPPPILPPLPDHHDHDQDVHDIDIHASPFSSSVSDSIPVLSIHDPSVYYSPFSDCCSFSHLPPYAYPPHGAHVPHPDLHFALHNDAFAHNSPHMSPKHLHHSQDLGLRGASSLHDSRFHSSPSSLAFLPPLHDLSCPPDHASHPFAMSPPKPPGLAHTLLPPIVQSNPAELSRADIEASLPKFSFVSLLILVLEPVRDQTLNHRLPLSGRPVCSRLSSRSAWRGKMEYLLCSTVRATSWPDQIKNSCQR